MKPTRPPEPEDKSQRAVQSVEVGGRLLLALAESESDLGLKDLAARGGMSASRAHPYLVSYSRLGLVEQDPATGRYELGPAALKIGLACLRRLNPLKAADPVIRELAAETGHTVALAVWGNFGPTVVRLIEARGPLHVAMRLGTVLSVWDTATGRAFAAALPADRLQEGIAGPLGEVAAHETLREKAALLDEVKGEMRRHGVSRSVGRPIPGVNAFSAPVYDQDGAPALVVTVTDQQDRLPGTFASAGAQAVRAAAARITARLGGTVGQQP